MTEPLRWIKVRAFESASARKHKDGRPATNYDRYYLRSDGLVHVEHSGTLCANTDEDAPVFHFPTKDNGMNVSITVWIKPPRAYTEQEFDRDFLADLERLNGTEIPLTT